VTTDTRPWLLGEQEPAGPPGLPGPEGPEGPGGPEGEPGTDGRTILHGAGNPAAGTGEPGDFYLNTTAHTLFGPKDAAAWPSPGVSLVGPEGPPGPQTLVHIGDTPPATHPVGTIWADTS
jgi:hypothetical protein